MVEGHRRQRVDPVPGGVGGDAGLGVGRDQPEVRRGEDPAARVPVRVAAGLELLEVPDGAHVDLLGEVPGDAGAEPGRHPVQHAGKSPVA